MTVVQWFNFCTSGYVCRSINCFLVYEDTFTACLMFLLPPDLFCQKFRIPKPTQIAFMQRNLKTKYFFIYCPHTI